MSRKHNFSAGPGTLPLPVLESINAELLDHGHGASILETSHRSEPYSEILFGNNERLRRLLGISEDFEILWLQGGASHQFAMVPMNFLHNGRKAAYVVTGTWSEKALAEARDLGNASIAATGKDGGFRALPRRENWEITDGTSYLHMTSNNTIYGTQYHQFPSDLPCRLVCDMSSDILSHPFNVDDFDLIYAGAQKNLGPAGVTLAIIRKEWLAEANDALPTILRYQTHAEKESRFNTPPVFPIYVVGKVLEWVEANGGAQGMESANRRKSERIYGVLEAHPEFYKGHAETDSRSSMNITFNLPNADLESQFLVRAEAAGMMGLKGHRSIGGIRASTYNAIPEASVFALAELMEEFVRTAG